MILISLVVLPLRLPLGGLAAQAAAAPTRGLDAVTNLKSAEDVFMRDQGMGKEETPFQDPTEEPPQEPPAKPTDTPADTPTPKLAE